MFFLHTLALKQKMLQVVGDEDALATIPEVTIYEKAPGTGGVWHTNVRKSELPSNLSR
jgi:hypothetical protein